MWFNPALFVWYNALMRGTVPLPIKCQLMAVGLQACVGIKYFQVGYYLAFGLVTTQAN